MISRHGQSSARYILEAAVRTLHVRTYGFTPTYPCHFSFFYALLVIVSEAALVAGAHGQP